MKQKILIVDDEIDIQVYLSTLLEDNGYLVVTVENYENSLQEITTHLPDLIILDIMMPGFSGLSLYKDIRKQEKTTDIPVLMISGFESKKNFSKEKFNELVKDESLSFPNGFLDKPINIDILLKTVEQIFQKKI